MPIDVNCSAWKGFRTGEWRHLVNVRNFIQKNYTPYAGDESFLAPTSERTQKVWDKSHELILEPYHTLGVNKYHALGIPYSLEDVPALPPEALADWQRRFDREFHI